MARRRLRIQRKAYARKSYKRKGFTMVRAGKRIRIKPTSVKATRVPATKFYRKDIGAVGRSKRPAGVPDLKKGRMSREVAKALGYAKAPTKLTNAEWKKVFRKSQVSGKAWLGMLGTQVARRKFATPSMDGRLPTKRAFQRAIGVLAQERTLTPKEAIRAWKMMPSAERARRMPERK